MRSLGDLADEVVFVGGATIGLWISDPVAPAPRVTNDVDGRPGPGAEIAATPEPLRADLAEGFTRMASRADLPELIEAALPPEARSAARAEVVARRWRAIAVA